MPQVIQLVVHFWHNAIKVMIMCILKDFAMLL